MARSKKQPEKSQASGETNKTGENVLVYRASRIDKIKTFLYIYYAFPKLNFLKILTGPILILGSLFMILSGIQGEGLLFLLAFGSILTIWPYLFVLNLLRKYGDSQDTLRVEKNVLSFETNDVKMSLDLNYLQYLFLQKQRLSVSIQFLETKPIVFSIRSSQVQEGSLEAFHRELEPFNQDS